MIDRPHFNGPISFHCDRCSEAIETHCENFSGALAKMKSRGWTVAVATRGGRNNDFEHRCKDCSQ